MRALSTAAVVITHSLARSLSHTHTHTHRHKNLPHPQTKQDCKPACESVTTPVCNKVPQQSEVCADVPVYTKVPACQEVCEDMQIVCNSKGKKCKAVPVGAIGAALGGRRRSLQSHKGGKGLSVLGKGALLVGKAAPVVSATTSVCKKVCEYQVQTNYVKQCKTVTSFAVVCNDVTQQVCKNVCTTTCVEEAPVLVADHKGPAVYGKAGLLGKKH